MSKFAIIILVLLLSVTSLLAVACTGQLDGPADTQEPSSTPPNGTETNFRLLISDDVNAIEKFISVNVTISEIGVHSSSGNWTIMTPDITVVDLKPLVDENALEIWSGNLTAGEYNKVFVYVTDVIGTLKEEYGGGTADIKLPGDKLHIARPFTISGNMTTNFVYDITVIEAGKSGQYILKPQIAQSGADQKFREVKQEHKGNVPRSKFSLENTDWILKSYGPSDNLTPVIDDTGVTLRFDKAAGTFGGSAGCNNYGGSYEVDSNNLSLADIVHTEMYCVEPEGIMEQETAYLARLQTSTAYQLDDGCLTIICGGGVLNFEVAEVSRGKGR